MLRLVCCSRLEDIEVFDSAFGAFFFPATAALAQTALPPLKNAWGGGTRIGENLWGFGRDHAARVLTPDTLVLVSSDSLDVGETDVLAFASREIKRRSAGIVWLNPLATHPAFQPTARGKNVETAMFIFTRNYGLGHLGYCTLGRLERVRV